jgi:hypothetical protein
MFTKGKTPENMRIKREPIFEFGTGYKAGKGAGSKDLHQFFWNCPPRHNIFVLQIRYGQPVIRKLSE